MATPCPAGGRGANAERPCGAEGCRRRVQGGPDRKGLRCSLGPMEWRTTSGEAVRAKGARGAGSKGKSPMAAVVGSTLRYWGAQVLQEESESRGGHSCMAQFVDL